MNGADTDVFNDVLSPRHLDPYMFHAWVNIAVDVLIRNVARASFGIKRNGEDVTTGKLYELFRRPNENMSCYDLWKALREHAAKAAQIVNAKMADAARCDTDATL
jgi:hypothetical protein